MAISLSSRQVKKEYYATAFSRYSIGGGREVFLGTFQYYRIENITELFDRPFHIFWGALNTSSLFLNVRRMIQYRQY
ncbi:hypothetical protein ABH959_005121 [Bacillus sp. RC51]